MNTNRQINTGFNAQKDQKIVLEASRVTKVDGKIISQGQTIEVTKSEAKRIISLDKSAFHIKMD